MFEWLSNAFSAILQAITGVAQAVVDLGASIVVLIQFAGQAVVLIVSIVFQLLNILGSFALGLINTIKSVTAPAWSVGGFSTGWQNISGIVPLEAVGWAVAGLVWIFLAVCVIRALQKGG